jgi:CHASE2 domain-containing sensor protein
MRLKRVPWQPILRKTLERTVLIALVMLAVNYIQTRDLLGPLSILLKIERDGPLDLLSRGVYRWPAPIPKQKYPPVFLIELEQQSIQTFSPQGYLFHRGQMAKLLSKLAEYKPKGVLLDLDLAQPSNEGGVLSAGDRELLATLKRLDYPLLIPDDTALNQPIAKVNPKLYRVGAYVLYEGSGMTRLIPAVKNGGRIPSALALYCVGLGLDLHNRLQEDQCRRYGQGSGEGKRIVYREIPRYGPNAFGEQRWQGLMLLSGVELLQDSLVKGPETEGAVFVVGRTFPEASDLHFTPVGAMQGVDIHLNALMTLVTYGHLSDTVSIGLLVLFVLVFMFGALLIVYIITDGLIQAAKWQDVARGFLEAGLTAWIMFFAGRFVVQRFGFFLDYMLPIAAFHLLLLGMKVFKRGGKRVEVRD